MGILSTEQIDKCKVKIHFSYDKEKISTVVNDIARNVGKNYMIKGYRKGKAPVEAVKVNAKKYILENAKQKLSLDAFEDILYLNKWKPFGPPEIKKIDLDYDYFSLILEFGYLPEFELAQYKDMKLEDPDVPSFDYFKTEVIKNICSQNSETKPFSEDDFVLSGDDVVINYCGKIDGQDFENNKGEGAVLKIGANNALPGFEDSLIGMKVGESREFEIVVDESVKNKTIAGKTVSFTVDLLSAGKAQPADYNDELALKLGAESIAKVDEEVDKRAKDMYSSSKFVGVKNTIIDNLVDSNSFEIPTWMIQQAAEMYATKTGKNYQEIEGDAKLELLKNSEKDLRLAFVLDKLKDKEPETALASTEIVNILNANLHRFPDEIREQLIAGKNQALNMQVFNDIQNEHILRWVADKAIYETKKVDNEENKGE